MNMIENHQWTVLAVESILSKKLDSVLDQHAHKNVGTFDNISSAVVAAESYATEWWFDGKIPAKCACPEIKLKRGK